MERSLEKRHQQRNVATDVADDEHVDGDGGRSQRHGYHLNDHRKCYAHPHFTCRQPVKHSFKKLPDFRTTARQNENKNKIVKFIRLFLPKLHKLLT